MDRRTTPSLWERWLAATLDALPLLVVSIPFLLRRRGRHLRCGKPPATDQRPGARPVVFSAFLMDPELHDE